MAYTPGLKRKKSTIIRKTRKSSLSCEVLVNVGDIVSPEKIIARTTIPGDPHLVNVANIIGEEPAYIALEDDLARDLAGEEWIKEYMVKREGEEVDENEVIAKTKGLFGYFIRYCRSPIKGTIEHISPSAGQVIIRAIPQPIELSAYIPGTVIEVLPKEGAVIETPAAFIQGILGVGGETHGEIMTVVDSPEETLTAKHITPESAGKVLIGGSLVTGDALRKAVDAGVKGIVIGGIKERDLAKFLGYELGVAITGHEKLGLTLIVMEGFGKMKMCNETFELLKSFTGRQACINGATQIRAGVMRPEIIVPLEGIDLTESDGREVTLEKGLIPGLTIRVIREPYFGALGHVVSLSVELQLIETESMVRVLEAELEDGRRIIIPRANVEIVEE